MAQGSQHIHQTQLVLHEARIGAPCRAILSLNTLNFSTRTRTTSERRFGTVQPCWASCARPFSAPKNTMSSTCRHLTSYATLRYRRGIPPVKPQPGSTCTTPPTHTQLYFADEPKKGRGFESLYELVQHAGNVLPRLCVHHPPPFA